MNRKDFLKQTGFAALALLMHKVEALDKKKPYAYLENSNENVVYYTKSDVAYDSLRKGFNKRINKFPHTIALCQNTAGVAEAVAFANKNKLKVTVKSGGHCMEGFSCIEDGLVINLSLLNNIEFVDANTIKVGPACTLKKIYETLLPKGKYLPGGSCQTVAIGGLTLGGGYGLLSRRYGLTCDSLQDITMVSGDAEIVHTKNDKELLWACKGGGNGNFGAITEMKFSLQKAPATMKSYKFRNQKVDIVGAKNICAKWFELVKTLPNSCFSAFIFNGRTTYILLTNVQENNATVNNVINEFTKISTKVTNTKALPLASALKNYYAEPNPITFKNASAGLYKNYEEIESILEAVFTKVKETPGILYQVNTLGGNIQNTEFENKSAFAHRDCFYFSELQAYWESASVSNKYLNSFESIQLLFAEKGIKAQYRNYPDVNFKNTDQLYYGKNLERLQLVKNRYDNKNIFDAPQTLQSTFSKNFIIK
jgi:FAD binding domain/Berberine and berberine like